MTSKVCFFLAFYIFNYLIMNNVPNLKMNKNPILIFTSGQDEISLSTLLLLPKYPGYDTIIESLTQTLN